MAIEALLPEWLGWLKRIENEVSLLLRDRYILRQTLDIVQANPRTHDPNDFVDWFVCQFADSAIIRVRRQVDRRRDSISLLKLFEDLQRKAAEITRTWYVASYPKDMRAHGMADCDFDRWSGPNNDHVDAGLLRKHRSDLIAACRSVETFASERIAHHGQTPDSRLKIPTWRELDHAIDTLDKKTCECIALLRQECAVNGLLPTWQYDWKRVFDAPWRNQRGHGRRL